MALTLNLKGRTVGSAAAEQRMCPDLHVYQLAQVTALAQVDFPS